MSESLTTSSIVSSLPLITSVTKPTDVASKIRRITAEENKHHHLEKWDAEITSLVDTIDVASTTSSITKSVVVQLPTPSTITTTTVVEVVASPTITTTRSNLTVETHLPVCLVHTDSEELTLTTESAALTTSSPVSIPSLITSVTKPTDVASKASSTTAEKTSTTTRVVSSEDPDINTSRKRKILLQTTGIIQTSKTSSKKLESESKNEITRTDSTRVPSIIVEKPMPKPETKNEITRTNSTRVSSIIVAKPLPK